MKRRKTVEKKMKVLAVRLTEEEHANVKINAIQKGLTMTRFVLEAVRDYLRKKT